MTASATIAATNAEIRETRKVSRVDVGDGIRGAGRKRAGRGNEKRRSINASLGYTR